jgi:hypothetical protein
MERSTLTSNNCHHRLVADLLKPCSGGTHLKARRGPLPCPICKCQADGCCKHPYAQYALNFNYGI